MWIPEIEAEETAAPVAASATWHIDWQHGRVGGRIEEKEALAQSIGVRLQTELGQYDIYSQNYGLERWDISGEVGSIMARRVSACLAEEERVTGISGFTCQAQGDSCQLSFTVHTIWGDTQAALEI